MRVVSMSFVGSFKWWALLIYLSAKPNDDLRSRIRNNVWNKYKTNSSVVHDSQWQKWQSSIGGILIWIKTFRRPTLTVSYLYSTYEGYPWSLPLFMLNETISSFLSKRKSLIWFGKFLSTTHGSSLAKPLTFWANPVEKQIYTYIFKFIIK